MRIYFVLLRIRGHLASMRLYTRILKHVIPAGIVGIQKPWMAIAKQTVSINRELLNKIEHSHPCALDSGNPCRNDGVTQTLVY